ncbi:MAG: hypothetical protein ACOYZ7_15965 [Chloroflexota bacterium]
MRVVFNIRERMGRVVAAGIGTLFLLACGALLAFVLSPGQSLEARRIDRLPEMTAEDVSTAAAGEDILVTGRLEGNAVVAEGGFVAHVQEEWRVTMPTPGSQSSSQSSKPAGQWQTVQRVVPALALDVDGRSVEILPAGNARLSGSLHERLVRSRSFRQAEYNTEMLPEGSMRTRGFFNGDLITVLGSKASSGGVIPEELYMGDRVGLVAYKKNAATGLLVGGLCMMGLAPVVLIGGILSALLGRR